MTRLLAAYLFSRHQTSKESRHEDLFPWVEDHRKEAVLDMPYYNPSLMYIEAVRTMPSPMEGRRSIAGSRSARLTWLPPLRFHLPPTPEENQEGLLPLTSPSHPPLLHSQTCASSIYSQNTTGSPSTASLRPSTLSSLSSHSSSKSILNPHLKQVRSVQESSTPIIPAKYLQRSRTLNDGSRPVRPGTRPAMPPAESWKYAEKQHMRLHSLSHSSTFRTLRTQRVRKPFTRREPSLCRYPILPLPAQPVCRTRRATVHSETAHIKTASYESIRKDTLHTLNGDDNLVRLTHWNTQLQGTAADSRSDGQRRKARQSRTLRKKRQPDYV